jgi:hypothetical protein
MISVSKYSLAKNDNTYLYTKGGEYSLDGAEYVGEYHIEGYTAKTGPIQSPESKVLQKLFNNPDHYIYNKIFNFQVPILKYVDPVPYLYRPIEQVYQVGIDTRYFVEKINDDSSYAIEIDTTQHKLLGKPNGIDRALYDCVSISWKLTGYKDDIVKYNQASISAGSLKVPSLIYSIKNFLEHARITFV